MPVFGTESESGLSLGEPVAAMSRITLTSSAVSDALWCAERAHQPRARTSVPDAQRVAKLVRHCLGKRANLRCLSACECALRQ